MSMFGELLTARGISGFDARFVRLKTRHPRRSSFIFVTIELSFMKQTLMGCLKLQYVEKSFVETTLVPDDREVETAMDRLQITLVNRSIRGRYWLVYVPRGWPASSFVEGCGSASIDVACCGVGSIDIY